MKNNLKGEVKIQPSLLERAIGNNPEALEIMFKQFIPEDEEINISQYLGIKGLWGIGAHSFTCLTHRRVADISVGRFGEVIYQDGYLEFINSSAVLQPSKLALYLFVITWVFLSFLLALVIGSTITSWVFGNLVILVIVTALVFMLLTLLVPFIVKFYYGAVKCGIIFWIKEGIPVYIFANRKFIVRANMFCREVALQREKRLKALQKSWR